MTFYMAYCVHRFSSKIYNLLRVKNKSIVNKSRRRPPPNRRKSVEEETMEEDEDDEVEGEEGSSLKRKVCKHFLKGTCNFGSSCWKFHDLSGMDLRKKIPRY